MNLFAPFATFFESRRRSLVSAPAANAPKRFPGNAEAVFENMTRLRAEAK